MGRPAAGRRPDIALRSGGDPAGGAEGPVLPAARPRPRRPRPHLNRVHLVAYLIDLGHPAAFAATVTGLLGVLSVTGRLVTTAISRRMSLTTISAVIFIVQAGAALLLPVSGRGSVGAVGCVLGIGLGFGVVSIIKPALLAAQYDTAAFGTLSGLIMLPTAIAKALGPFAAAALLATTGSYTWVIIVVGGAFLVSALATYSAGRHRHPEHAP